MMDDLVPYVVIGAFLCLVFMALYLFVTDDPA